MGCCQSRIYIDKKKNKEKTNIVDIGELYVKALCHKSDLNILEYSRISISQKTWYFYSWNK
jgi:hypothetical protein